MLEWTGKKILLWRKNCGYSKNHRPFFWEIRKSTYRLLSPGAFKRDGN